MLTRHASTSEERREYEERVGSAATGSGLNGQRRGNRRLARWLARAFEARARCLEGWVPNGPVSALGALSQPEL